MKGGERIFIVASHKDDGDDRDELWKGAALRLVDGWQVPEARYGILISFFGISSLTPT